MQDSADLSFKIEKAAAKNAENSREFLGEESQNGERRTDKDKDKDESKRRRQSKDKTDKTDGSEAWKDKSSEGSKINGRSTRKWDKKELLQKCETLSIQLDKIQVKIKV